MELFIGIIVGSLLGFLLSLIPGFNIGFAFLAAPLIPAPRFAIGLIIGVDLTTSTLKSLHFLNCSNREDLEEDITKHTNKVKLAAISAFNYYFIKVLSAFTIIILMLVFNKSIFEVDFIRSLTLGASAIIWFTILQQTKHWRIGLLAFIGYTIFSIFTIKLDIQQPMFILASSLFSANFINEIRYKSEKVSFVEVNLQESPITINGFLAGLLSGFLWGLPTSLVCKVVEDEGDSPEVKISRLAVADAVTSVLGLTLLMALGGSRSAANQAAASFNEVFSRYEIAVVMLIIIIASHILFSLWKPITKLYISFHNKTPYIIKQISVMLTVISLVIISNGMFLLTSLIALMLAKLVRIAEAPKELCLSPISILPVAALLKFW